MNKTTLAYGILLGALISITSFHAYEVYQIRKVTIQNQSTINQIVNFINANTQQPAGNTGTPAHPNVAPAIK